MNEKINKSPNEAESRAAHVASESRSIGGSRLAFVDNRPESVAQRKLAKAINNSPRLLQMRCIQKLANKHSSQVEAAIHDMPIQRVVRAIAGGPALGLAAINAHLGAVGALNGYFGTPACTAIINIFMLNGDNTLADLTAYLIEQAEDQDVDGGHGGNNTPNDEDDDQDGAPGGVAMDGIGGGGVAAAAA